ncbi:hypothetical protein SAMN05216188_11262 [Lentzea xinjiangensis]|uniref:Uncharacterized protein n=1 Tax=Lentzea xinjiangensis TaxID=402600 RepID=A0A1H9PSQ7_9PSEU|nr:hypothetical protein [Lentzea xinjiangensis]SER51264.1 hypothetical protein SAMN05216188_11262 [Lentzea xinjiangensis]
MKKAITALSLVAALFTASSVPAASVAPAAPEPPAACAALMADFAEKLKKAVAGLVPTPNVGAVSPLVGDLLGLIEAMQNAGCLPAPPVTAPGAPAPGKAAEHTAPANECLSAVLKLISSVAALGGAIFSPQPDPAKVKELLTALLKSANELLEKCGLQAPPGGLPPLPAGTG